MTPPKTPHIIDNTVKAQLFLILVLVGFLSAPKIFATYQNYSQHLAERKQLSLVPIPTTPTAEVATTTPSASTTPKTKQSTAPKPRKSTPYTEVALRAKSVYVWDINDHKPLFARNEHAQLPLASLTKMMMALVALDILQEDTTVTIDRTDLEQEGDSRLSVGESWSLKDLLKLTLVSSSNDGASAIAAVAGMQLTKTPDSNRTIGKELFVQKMNEKSRSIGLENTYFRNEHGLDITTTESGAYGTARDMAMLFDTIYRTHPEVFEDTNAPKVSLESESHIPHRVLNTNIDAGKIAGLIGSKTGFTDLAGGNLVVIVDIGLNHPVVIAVLGSTINERFTDVDKLINATIRTITEKDHLTASTTQSYAN